MALSTSDICVESRGSEMFLTQYWSLKSVAKVKSADDNVGLSGLPISPWW
jgi:hypothetical protein